MRMVEAFAIVAVLLTAGCMSDAPAAASDLADAATQSDARAEDGSGPQPALVAGAAALDVTTWANGTFSAERAARVADQLPGAPVGEPAVVMHDLTSIVPRGVPVRIFAEVVSEMSNGDLDLFLQVPPGEWRTGNFLAPYGGSSRFEVGVVHVSSDPIQVGLAYDVIEPAQEVAYRLSIRVVADPGLLVNGIVAGVTLPADARFEVQLEGEPRAQGPEIESVALMVFAPDDGYLGRFPLDAGVTPIALPAGSPAGEYVLMLTQGGRNARLLVDGAEAAPMRPLGLSWTGTDPVPLDQEGAASWTVEHERVPLLVGLEFSSPNVARQVDFGISGPEGSVFAAREETDVPWLAFAMPDGTSFGNAWGWDSLWGAVGLVEGAYTHTVAFETAAGAQPGSARSYAAFYAR